MQNMKTKPRKWTCVAAIHDEIGLCWGEALKSTQGYAWAKGEDAKGPDEGSKFYRSLSLLQAGLFVDEGFGHRVPGQGWCPRLRVEGCL